MARCQRLVERISIALAAALLSRGARAADPEAIAAPPAYPVHVRLLGDRPDFKLRLDLARIGAEDAPLCTEPCDRTLSIKPYQRFLISPERASGAVNVAFEELPAFALPSEPASVLIRVQSGRPERRIAGAFVLGGGLVFTGLGVLTALGGQAAIAAESGAAHGTARTVRDAGFIAGGAGILLAVTGLFLIDLSPAPRATIEPARSGD